MNKTLEGILYKVSKSPIVDNGDLTQASDFILNSLIEGLQVQRAGIWLFDEKQGGLLCFLLIANKKSFAENRFLERTNFPQYFSSLESSRAVPASDARTHPDTKELNKYYLEPLNIYSMLSTPIQHCGKMVGVISCEHTETIKNWEDDEIVFSSAMADLIGRAISAKERNYYALELENSNRSLEKKIKNRTLHLEETISLLKKVQAKLAESEKLASLGALVAGIAHEVNTPLGVAITANSHLNCQLKKICKEFSNDELSEEGFKEYLDDAQTTHTLIHENLDRAATLVGNFKKTAADQQQLEAESVVLKDYINQVLLTLAPLLKRHKVKVEVHGPETPLTIYVGAIAQIITNFVTNSCNHGFKNQNRSGGNKVSINISHKKGVFWELEYRDNGEGMNEQSVQKIYEPFYTTSRGEGGTGLGMSIVYNLIQQKLSGTISLKTAPGEGVNFIILFPELNTEKDLKTSVI